MSSDSASKGFGWWSGYRGFLGSPHMGKLRTPEKVRRLLSSQHGIKCDVQFVELDRYHQDYDYCLDLIQMFAKYVNRHGKNTFCAESIRKSLTIDCGIKISNY